MSLLTQDEMAENDALRRRVAQSAASQKMPYDNMINGPMDPDMWMDKYKREWAAAPGWDIAWEEAKLAHVPPIPPPLPPEDPLATPATPPSYVYPIPTAPLAVSTYDPGMDETVITDGMIMSQVQFMLA